MQLRITPLTVDHIAIKALNLRFKLTSVTLSSFPLSESSQYGYDLRTFVIVFGALRQRTPTGTNQLFIRVITASETSRSLTATRETECRSVYLAKIAV